MIQDQNRKEGNPEKTVQLNANCPFLGMMILKKKRAKQCPLPFTGMMNPQFQVVTGNSPAQGIARDYPKAGKQ